MSFTRVPVCSRLGGTGSRNGRGCGRACRAAASRRAKCRGGGGCCCLSHLEDSNQIRVAQLARALPQAGPPLLSVLQLFLNAFAFGSQVSLLGFQASNALEKRLPSRVFSCSNPCVCCGALCARHGAGCELGGRCRGSQGNSRRARGSVWCSAGVESAGARFFAVGGHSSGGGAGGAARAREDELRKRPAQDGEGAVESRAAAGTPAAAAAAGFACAGTCGT